MKRSALRDLLHDTAKKVTTAPVTLTAQTVKNGLKSAISKANPFDKKINKNDVTDTGAESIRLTFTSAKKAKNTVKTVSQSVKTTTRTVKTAGKVTKAAIEVAYKAPVYTVKAVVGVVRITANAITNVVAALTNPVVIIILVLLVCIFYLLAAVVAVLFGGDTADKVALTEAVGLVDVSDQYLDGLEFFSAAVQKKQEEFNAMIDRMYYNYTDLTHSDLAYMERTKASGYKTTYERNFATDSRKDTLKSGWDFSDVTAMEIIAIAYIYLEKQENEAHGTEGGIYEVEFTQELFDEIIDKCVSFNDSTYGGQVCPNKNCTKHIEYVENPAWLEANARLEEALRNNEDATNRRDWESQRYWYDEYYRRLAYRDGLQHYNEVVTYICEYQHTLHSVGLWYYDKETVMNALGFTDFDKQWVSLTEMGFANNSDIS